MVKKLTNKFNPLKFILCVLITESAGLLGSFATITSVNSWYLTDLIKPSFNPPSWLFGPVWTILFFLMGWALYLVWNKKNNLTYFWTQLVLNIIWSYLFFGLRSPLLAFIEIVILWIFILLTTIKFYSYHKTAGLLFIPYLLWVTFASFLNLTIVLIN